MALNRKSKPIPFDAEIRSGGVGAILAKLFRSTMRDLGIIGIDRSEDRYDSLMERFIRRSAAYPDAKKVMTLRQGLSVELRKGSITWKTFMRGLEFLAVKNFDLVIHLQDKEGRISSHAVTSPILDNKNAGRVLAMLFDRIIFDLGITGDKYTACMDAYIDRSRAVIHKRQRAAIRAAMSKDLLKPNLTWKTFIKGLQFVGVSRFTLVLVLRHQVKKEQTQHIVPVELDGLIDDDSEDSDGV